MPVPTELDVLQDKIEEMEGAIKAVREQSAELYALRGEDAVVALHCNEITRLTEDY